MAIPTPDSAPLSPEFKRAINHLDKNIDKVPFTTNLPDHHIWKLNSFVKVRASLSSKNIPAGRGWRWSQTKGRRVVYLPHRRSTVTLFKLIPRTTKNSPFLKPPSFKLWKFELQDISTENYTTENGPATTIVWCERGERIDAHSLPQLQELKFLSEFMEPTQASCFWPSH